MSTEFMATCRGPNCSAEIIMGELNGRPHPWNKPTKCSTCKGNGETKSYAPTFFDDPMVATMTPCKKCKGAGTIRKSHFSSCPDADRFRQKKGEG